MSRDPEALRLECEYWQHVFEDLEEINRLIVAGAEAIAGGTVPMIGLAFALRSELDASYFAEVQVSQRAAMDTFAALQSPLDRLVSIAAGRGEVLRAEIAELRAGGEES